MQEASAQMQLFEDADTPDTMSAFTVRESGRAKRLSVKVYPRGRVEVVAPKRTRPADVQAFVTANREWIRKTREAYAREHPPEPFALPDSIGLPGAGLQFLVHYRPRPAATSVRYRCSGSKLVLSGRINDEKLCVEALKRWLASVARQSFEPRLRAMSLRTQNPFKKLQIRGQQTCWGSHSSTGTISLNFCLLFLEPAHVNYVMLHELCHARHMNHSYRFWKLVGRYEPNYEQLDEDLNSAWKMIPGWVGIY